MSFVDMGYYKGKTTTYARVLTHQPNGPCALDILERIYGLINGYNEAIMDSKPMSRERAAFRVEEGMLLSDIKKIYKWHIEVNLRKRDNEI